MNEQQVNQLIATMSGLMKAVLEQTAAINRLADSNESLSAMIYQSMYMEETEMNMPTSTYLSGKPKG
ncbi:hypothetical protein [Cronobacter sakazakii]|uniref:hypothetical protein n=1 Tax=Cronobacter sakazakii TaxID=28141 RepID=UPI000A0FA38B|nr:hypothetical protein [Cronobacter sakazakii]